ncbi:PEP-CTERM sorting domain-containing protein [Candidatus Poribacteria bacterium]|nr:PEP-CTERM sorting domain-containing protein [Candidatus Poribacteria bacterium]
MKRLLSVLVLVLATHAPLFATVIHTATWSGLPVVGEDPNVRPSGSAVFDVTGSTLTITLTNDTSDTLTAIGQVLSILTWDITDAGVTLTPGSALIASGSSLVGTGATLDTDLSREWAFKSNISAGSLGSFGIGAVGDILFGTDTFGVGDRFDTSGNLFGPDSPDGIDAAIVGPNVDLTADGFPTQGPLVQNKMNFTFTISGTLDAGEITNVQPLFGTDGAPVIPEPSTIVLLGIGLLGLVAIGRKKRKK